jgi:hypothetical protein
MNRLLILFFILIFSSCTVGIRIYDNTPIEKNDCIVEGEEFIEIIKQCRISNWYLDNWTSLDTCHIVNELELINKGQWPADSIKSYHISFYQCFQRVN